MAGQRGTTEPCFPYIWDFATLRRQNLTERGCPWGFACPPVAIGVSEEHFASIGALLNGQLTAGVVLRMSRVLHYQSPKWRNVSPLHIGSESPDF